MISFSGEPLLSCLLNIINRNCLFDMIYKVLNYISINLHCIAELANTQEQKQLITLTGECILKLKGMPFHVYLKYSIETRNLNI